MYVVIRQADVGEFDTLAAFENEVDADDFAALANLHDNGPDWVTGEHAAYLSFVEFTPVETDPRKAFRDIFDTDPPHLPAA